MALLQGAWTVGRTGYGMLQNAAREEEQARLAAQHQAKRAALLGQNTPLSGFADRQELEQYRYQPDGIYLGSIHDDHGFDMGAVGITDPRGIAVFAGARSGKGRTLAIQNAIRWPHPLLMIDPKGEAASITAMRRGTGEKAKGTGTSVRKFLGQRVAILDPFSNTQGAARIYQTSYNPLVDIDVLDEDYSEHIRAIVRSIVSPERGGAGEHFAEITAIMFRGLIETALIIESDPKRRTLPFVREVLFGKYDNILSYLERCPHTPAGFSREAHGIANDIGVDEWSGLRSTMSRNLEWIGSPKLLRHLQHSDFSLKRAVQEGWSIYIVLPPEKMSDYKAWLRVLVRTAINAKVAMGIDQTGAQTLFMLDEFPLLGHFQIIEDSAGFMAGYGIKLVPIIQNLTQLIENYPKNWEAFFANSAATVAFGMSTPTDIKHVSEMLGRVMVWEESYGISEGLSQQDQLFATGGAQSGSSSNLAQRERPVRFPNEVSHQSAPETMRAFVMPASGKPFMICRQNYDAIKTQGLFDSPAFIRRWEQHYGEKIK